MLVVAAGHAAVPSPSLALPSAPVLVLVLVLDDSIIGDANGAVGQGRFWAMAMAMAPPSGQEVAGHAGFYVMVQYSVSQLCNELQKLESWSAALR